MSVPTIIADANVRTQNALDSAQKFIDQLSELANDNAITFANNWNIAPWFNDLRGDVSLTEPAELSADVQNLHALPSLEVAEIVSLEDKSDYLKKELPGVWSNREIPEFNEKAPRVTSPDLPTTEAPSVPPTQEVQEIALQPWLRQNLPDEIALAESSLPSPNVLSVQLMDLTVPNLALSVPSNTFEYVENEYSSALLASLENLLLGDVQDGGYGINDSDEQGIYDRARDRQTKQTVVAVERARQGIASRGFPIPPGSLYAAERAIIQEGDAELSGLNREIVLNRSDLYLKARQFAVQQGISLEQALFSYVGSKQERALKAGQIAADLNIQFHNASVGLAQLQIELKRLYRDLHAEHLQTVAVQIQEYEHKLAHIKAEDARNQIQLQLHQHLLDRVRLQYEAQEAEDRHTQISVEIEKLRLQANQDRINTYATQVRARADEFDAYRIAWQGESVKQEVFKQQLAAHDQQMETVLKTSQLSREQFDAEVKKLELERERYEVILRERAMQLQENVAKAEAIARDNREYIDVWKISQDAKQYNIDKAFEHRLEHTTKILEALSTNIENLKVSSQAVLALKELNGASAHAGLQLYENMIAGSESSLSAIATLAEKTTG